MRQVRFKGLIVVGSAVVVSLAMVLGGCASSSSGGGTSVGELEWLVGAPGGKGYRDGVGEQARFGHALWLAPASDGSVVISDSASDIIRAADPARQVSTLAGQPGVGAFRDGPTVSALFDAPAGLAVAAGGTIYVADRGNDAIRRITPDGQVHLLAGLPGEDGAADGRGRQARFRGPAGVALDAAGRLWVADHYNDALRIVSPTGHVSTWPVASLPDDLAGADDALRDTRFPGIAFVAVDPAGAVVVAGDWGVSRIEGNRAVRMLTVMDADERQALLARAAKRGEATPDAAEALALRNVAGDGPWVQNISGLAVDGEGIIHVADAKQGRVFRLGPDGRAQVVAGPPSMDDDGAPARLEAPGAMAFDAQGRLLVAGDGGAVLQVLADGTVRDWVGQTRVQDTAGPRLGGVDVAVLDAQGRLFVVERLDHEIEQFDRQGRHVRRFGKDPKEIRPPRDQVYADGAPQEARFEYPADIEPGPEGVLFVADGNGIRQIDDDGQVSTLVAGAGSRGRRDGAFGEARFRRPYRLAYDGGGTLYLLENSPYVGGSMKDTAVRRIDLERATVDTVVDARALARLVPDAQARYFGEDVKDIATDAAGRLYLLGEHGSVFVRSPSGQMEAFDLFAGLVTGRNRPQVRDAQGQKVDNELIRATTPSGRTEAIAVDGEGVIYAIDPVAKVVLRRSPEGRVDVIAGTPGEQGSVGGPTPGSLSIPEALSITAEGDLLIADRYAGVIRIRHPAEIQGLALARQPQDNASRRAAP